MRKVSPKGFVKKACACHGGHLFAEHLTDVSSLQELKERLQGCLEDDLEYYRDEVEDYPEEQDKHNRLIEIKELLEAGKVVEAAIEYAVFLGTTSPEFNGLVCGSLLEHDRRMLKKYVARFMEETEKLIGIRNGEGLVLLLTDQLRQAVTAVTRST